jgi:hypothetical protein
LAEVDRLLPVSPDNYGFAPTERNVRQPFQGAGLMPSRLAPLDERPRLREHLLRLTRHNESLAKTAQRFALKLQNRVLCNS